MHKYVKENVKCLSFVTENEEEKNSKRLFGKF